MAYIELSGGRIAYDEAGSGPPVVLLHGAAQDSTVWRRVAPGLAGSHRVVAYDQPGHGKSDLWRGQAVADVNVYAQVLAELIEAWGIGPAPVVGHSLGGSVALKTALDCPGAVAAVVNLAGSAKSSQARIGYPGDLLELVSVNPTDWMETNFYALLLSPDLSEEERWACSFDPRRVPPEAIMGDLMAYTSCGFLDQLGRVTAPTLSVAGQYDWSCAPERVQATAQALGGPSQFMVLPGVGHMPQHECPDRLVEILLEFLNGLTVIPEEET
ncbi:MAG: alpha/beta hydrolase [Propionibacteriaceae bacterium]|jgi:pimeloyl-ACP methyl ester carboxylesterase|nr:alpha/beta hydrolase [Propionibacteriaceae bacterium]